MRVLHIAPTYFADSSVIGGGERYPTELAAHLSRRTETTLVSFSNRRRSDRSGALRIEIFPARWLLRGAKLNPMQFRQLGLIRNADVIHVHHINSLVSDLACLTARALRKKVFVTDYGGGAGISLQRYLPILNYYSGAVAYSEFGFGQLPQILQSKTTLIKGGVDTQMFKPDPKVTRKQQILYVGRLLPHKGVDVLIDAFRLLQSPQTQLVLMGRAYHSDYLRHLQNLSQGLAVRFDHGADDSQLLNAYQSSRITVLPSVHTDCYGNYTPVPELMGLTLLESQACGTPVVCSDAGAMKEFVVAGETGRVVKQNSPQDLSQALKSILDLSRDEQEAMSLRCVTVAAGYSWEQVVDQHMELYQTAPLKW